MYVRASFSNEDLEGMNSYSLTKLDQFDKPLHEYSQEFNNTYSYWNNDISVKAPMPMLSCKRPPGIIDQSSHGSHNSCGGSGSKGTSGSNLLGDI